MTKKSEANEAKPVRVNTHYAAIYMTDGRAVEPGQPIPDDASDEDRAILEANGHFAEQ